MRARSAMWGLASNDSRRAELADEALILVWGEMEMDRCGGGDVGFRSQRVWLIRWFRREEGPFIRDIRAKGEDGWPKGRHSKGGCVDL